MVGADGTLPLPWLGPWLADGRRRRAHALLLQGQDGVGQFELAVTLAQAWLCEAIDLPGEEGRPCGRCAACRLVQAHSHPDLLVVVPDALGESLGWGAAGTEAEEGAAAAGASGQKGGKAKPSKEIRVDAVRGAVLFAQTTASRGRGKVVVLHPAESMNAIASNTLLKTLEEPPGGARFLLSCGSADALLPTIRSRCQGVPLALPSAAVAVDWLRSRGVLAPDVLLAACGGQPLQAEAWFREGVDGRVWAQVPAWLRRGETAPFGSWPLPRLLEALQKVCHDALCVACGAPARYFPAGTLQPGPSVAALTEWAQSLRRTAEHAEHPWSAALMVESLVNKARCALEPASPEGPPRGLRSLHSTG